MNSTPQSAKEFLDRARAATVKVKTLEGEKTYAFQLLTRRAAVEVFHKSIQTILQTIAGIDLGAVQRGDISVDGLARGLAAIEFEIVWALGEKLLAFVQINGEEIQDINQSDYFGENPEELYIAIVHGIKVNYPKVFSKLRGALEGFGLADLVKKATESEPPSIV